MNYVVHIQLQKVVDGVVIADQRTVHLGAVTKLKAIQIAEEYKGVDVYAVKLVEHSARTVWEKLKPGQDYTYLYPRRP